MLKRLVGALCVVTLMGVFGSFWLGTGKSQSGPNSLQGIVTDQEGTPVSAALVRARHLQTGVSKIGLTDPQGKFWLPQLRKGQYQISAGKKGYDGGNSQTVDVEGPLEDLHFNLTVLPIVPASQLSSDDIIRYLPEGPGKMMVSGSCGACHSLRLVFSQGGRSRSEWTAVLKRMLNVPGGYIQINDDNTPPIIDYLTKYLGPDSRLPEELGSKVKNVYREELPAAHVLIYTEYDIPTPLSAPHTAIPDNRGNVWFSEYGAGKIGRVTLDTGKITEYPLKTPDHHPHGITVGDDGVVWYPAPPFVLGRLDPETGEMAEYRVPDFEDGQNPMPHSIVVAKDGKVWFTETHRPTPGAISSYDPDTRQFKRYMLEEGSVPYGIIEKDGIIWFTLIFPGKLGFLDPKTGEMQYFAVPTEATQTRRLRFDTKGRLWFGEFSTDKIGVFDPSTKEFTEYDLPFRGSPYSIHVDADDYVWAACFDRDSFIRFDPDTKTMLEYPLPGSGVIIRDIWADEQGRMWFAQNGLNKISSAEYVLKPAAR